MQAETRNTRTTGTLCALAAVVAVNMCGAAELRSESPAATVAIWEELRGAEPGWVSTTAFAAAAVDAEWSTSASASIQAPSAVDIEAPEPEAAQSPEAPTNAAEFVEATGEAPELHGLLQRVAWVTGCLALIALFALGGLRTWLTRPRSAGSSGRTLQLIESLRIGSRCGVFLVQADHHRVLISIDQGRGMQMLSLPPSFTETLQELSEEPDEVAAAPRRRESLAEPVAGLASRREWRAGAST